MIKQAIIVPRSLHISAGKLAAQVAHAAIGARDHTPPSILTMWRNGGMTKIVLRVESPDQLYPLMQQATDLHIPYYLVRDAGHTQIEPGTITALAIGPGEIDVITKGLKLY